MPKYQSRHQLSLQPFPSSHAALSSNHTLMCSLSSFLSTDVLSAPLLLSFIRLHPVFLHNSLPSLLKSWVRPSSSLIQIYGLPWPFGLPLGGITSGFGWHGDPRPNPTLLSDPFFKQLNSKVVPY